MLYSIFYEIPSITSSLCIYGCIHHHDNISPSSPITLKLNGATPRTGKPLFWVISPESYTPICVQRARRRQEKYSCCRPHFCRLKHAHPPHTALMIPARKTPRPAKSSLSYYSGTPPNGIGPARQPYPLNASYKKRICWRHRIRDHVLPYNPG